MLQEHSNLLQFHFWIGLYVLRLNLISHPFLLVVLRIIDRRSLILEVDVPEQFYNRKSVEYKVKSCNNEKIDINKIETSINKTSFKIYIPEMLLTDEVDYDLYRSDDVKEISDKMLLQKEYAETSDGKRFEVSQNGTNEYGVPEGENKIINYTQTFDLTTFDATDEISVHIFTNKGKEIIIKLAQ